MPEKERNLTDADVDAVVEGLWKKLRGSFITNLGEGVWGLLWKGALGVILLIALYGASGHK